MVKMRLARRGRKKLALFDIVVAPVKAPRDGRFIEKIGVYNPNSNPATIELDDNKAFQWLMNGAQPTDTMRRILSYRGVLMRKHLQIGVNKGAISQEQADAKLAAWKAGKQSQIDAKVTGLADKKAQDAKARMAAETKAKEAKAIAIQKKAQVVEAPAENAEGGAEEQA
jgi:small subunit ribosomal protein S16